VLIYDAGAFIAAERGDRAMWIRTKAALLEGQPPATSAAVIAQVWRGEARHARLSRLVAAVETTALTARDARQAGALLARTSTSDSVHAALMLTAADGDLVYTSDPDDLAQLAHTLGLHVEIIPV
jgi:hypothetical protein